MSSGGSKRELYEFTKRLKRDGNSISLYTNSKEEGQYLDLSSFVDHIFEYKYKKFKNITFTLPFLKSILNLVISLLNIKRLIKISKKMAKNIDSKGYEFIFIHHNKEFVQSPFLLKYLKTKTIYFCAEPQRIFYDEGLFKKLKSECIEKSNYIKSLYTFFTNLIDNPCKYYLMKKIKEYDFDNVKYSDLILTNSNFSYEKILSAYGLNSRVVHLGGDIYGINKKKLKYKKNQILTIGSINPIKCFDFITIAIGLIKKEIRPNLVIVGNSVNNNYLRKLKEIAIENNVDISFMINISDDDLKKVIMQSYIFAYTPYLEPLGLAPLEAMSLGLPIVAIKEGGIRETVIDGYNGFILERNKKEFSNKITELIEDKKKYMEMGDNSITHINRYWNWDMAYKRFMESIT